MHWFWRATIAVGVGAVSTLGVHQATRFIYYMFPFSPGRLVVAMCMILTIPPVTSIYTYVLLARRFGPWLIDPETRCRGCHYILRGITEPRWPECGERI